MSLKLKIIGFRWAGLVLVSLVFLSSLSAVRANGVSCAPIPDGLVSWWAADGNAFDIKDANDGTLIGASYESGKVNQAFGLNGSSGYVQLMDSESLRPAGALTVEAWIKLATTPTGAVIIFDHESSNPWYGYGLAVSPGPKLSMDIYNTSSVSLVGNTVLPVGEWIHVAMTYDGSFMRLYVNGTEDGSLATSGPIDYTLTLDPAIGRRATGGGNYFPGAIDEVAIFARALSSGEIQSLFSAGYAGKCRNCTTAPSGMVGWWPGDGSPFDIQGSLGGTINGGAFYAGGMVGQAFDFSGGASDYVSIPNSAALSPSNAITIDAWIYPRDVNTDQHIVSTAGNGPSPFGHDYYLRLVSGSLEFRINDDPLWAGGVVSAPNRWYHVAATYRSGGQRRIYVDGQLVASNNYGPGINTGHTVVTIGVNARNAAHSQGFASFNGRIDEIEVFDRELSHADLRLIVSAGNAGKCRQCTAAPVGLVGWWPGDGNGLDARGGKNGSPVNGASFAEGLVGQSFYFNGNNNSFLLIPNTTNIAGGAEATYDAWAFPAADPAVGGYTAMISVGDSTLPTWNSQQCRLLYFNQTGTPQFYVDCGIDNANAGVHRFTANSYPPGIWYHVAAVVKNGNIDIYVNGTLDNGAGTTSPGSSINTGSDKYVSIGAMPRSDLSVVTAAFTGRMDEVEIFDRALTVGEIRSIVAAGRAGKCKPTARTVPAGLVGWWAGDGNSIDLAGTNNGTLHNGAGFNIGKVGQAFDLDGVNDFVNIGSPTNLTNLDALTLDAWVYMRSTSGNIAFVTKNGIALDDYGLLHDQFAGLRFTVNVNQPGGGGEVVGGPLSLYTWYHIAGTWDGTTMRLYKNGVEIASAPYSGRPRIDGSETLAIGRLGSYSGFYFNGLIDEVSIYNRALAPSEIQSIYDAGLAGKLKTVATLAPPKFGGNARGRSLRPADIPGVAVGVGDASLLFPSVTSAGLTQEVPLDPSKLPPLPTGYYHTGLTYDISTSAVYSGSPIVCLNLPGLAADFPNLRLLHLESGSWVDRSNLPTGYPGLCSAGLTSLSPFALATLTPTAASAVVSGRVTDTSGNALPRIRVTLADMDGNVRTSTTGSFGGFSFDGITVGRNYIIQVTGNKRQFVDPVRLVYVADDVVDISFVAAEEPAATVDR